MDYGRREREPSAERRRDRKRSKEEKSERKDRDKEKDRGSSGGHRKRAREDPGALFDDRGGPPRERMHSGAGERDAAGSRQPPPMPPPERSLKPAADSGKALSDSAASQAAANASREASSRNWRTEVAADDEDERDLSDDEEATAKKMAASRLRREAMMAKWVNKDDAESAPAAEPGGSPGAGGETPVKAAASASPAADDDAGDASDGEASEAAASDGEAPDEDTRKKNAEVQKFILNSRKAEEEGGDMFGEGAAAAAALNSGKRQGDIGLTGASGHDWDDEEGYYSAKIGEVMDKRYLVVENCCGKGVFSNVVKAKDQKDGSGARVAIKIVRANDMMNKAAEKEIEILEKLNKADKGNKRHIVRLLETFYYRKHLCLVFECMWDDLRQAVKKYTKGRGMSFVAVRAYTKQLVVGLRHMHRCKIIHADIKPDNILISEGHNVVKFCDLGTAMEFKDVAVTPYLVSRYYRAPEIILGCEYGPGVDTFALGTTLYELFVGKILLQGKTNNEQLKKVMEVKGKIPKSIIRKGLLWKNHFNDETDFMFQDKDKITGQDIVRTITDLSAKRHLKDLILERVGPEKRQSAVKEDELYVKRAIQFADLLEQFLALDHEKRMTPEQALSHALLADPPQHKAGSDRAHR